HVRQDADARRRRERRRGRSVPARVDSEPIGQDHGGLPAGDADLSRPRERRRPARAHRVHQVAEEELTKPTVLSPPRHCMNDGYGIRSWLLTRDHKRIALLYLAGVTLFFFIGGAFAVMIRLELATPAGDLVSDETYNKLFTMHGVMMVFFFL